MAINYVAPSPPSTFTSSSHSSGGGGGGGLNPAMAIAQQNNQIDYLRLLQNKASMGVTARDQFQADAHLAAIDEQAQMHAWLNEQTMTMQDRQENAQIQAAVSEVQRKFTNGEYTRSDADSFIADLWSRGRLLKQKDDYTKTQAQAEMRKQIGEKHDLEGKLIAQRTELYGKTFNDRVAFFMDPTAHSQLADEIRTLQPGLEQANPGQFEQAIRQRAEDQGMGSHWYQEDVGKWKPVEKTAMPGRGQSASGAAGEKAPPGTMSDLQHSNLKLNIEKAIKHDAQVADQPVPSGDELKSKVDDKLREMGLPVSVGDLQSSRHPAEQKAHAVEAEKTDRLDKVQALGATLEGRTDLDPGKKQAAGILLQHMRKFIETHGVPKPGTDLRKRLDQIANGYKAIVGDVALPSMGTKVDTGEPQQPSLLNRIGSALSNYNPAAGGGGGY